MVRPSESEEVRKIFAITKSVEESSSGDEEPWSVEAGTVVDIGGNVRADAEAKPAAGDSTEDGMTNGKMDLKVQDEASCQLTSGRDAVGTLGDLSGTFFVNENVTKPVNVASSEVPQSIVDALNGETKGDATQRQAVAKTSEKAFSGDEVQDDLSKVALAPVSDNAVNSDNESAKDGGLGEAEETFQSTTDEFDQDSVSTPIKQVFEVPQKNADETLATELESTPNTWENDDDLYESSLALANDHDMEALEIESIPLESIAENGMYLQDLANHDNGLNVSATKGRMVSQPDVASLPDNMTPSPKFEEREEIDSHICSTTPQSPVLSWLFKSYVSSYEQIWQSQSAQESKMISAPVRSTFPPSTMLSEISKMSADHCEQGSQSKTRLVSQVHDQITPLAMLGDERNTVIPPPGLSSDAVTRQLNFEALAKVGTTDENQSNASVSRITALLDTRPKDKVILWKNSRKQYENWRRMKSAAAGTTETSKQSQEAVREQKSLSPCAAGVDDDQLAQDAWQDYRKAEFGCGWLNEYDCWEDNNRMNAGPKGLGYDDIPHYGPIFTDSEGCKAGGEAQDRYEWRGDERWKDDNRMDTGSKGLSYYDFSDYDPPPAHSKAGKADMLNSGFILASVSDKHQSVEGLLRPFEKQSQASNDQRVNIPETVYVENSDFAEAELNDEGLFGVERWLNDVEDIFNKTIIDQEAEHGAVRGKEADFKATDARMIMDADGRSSPFQTSTTNSFNI